MVGMVAGLKYVVHKGGKVIGFTCLSSKIILRQSGETV